MRLFIDLRDDDPRNEGDHEVEILDTDNLDGCDIALRFKGTDTEIVLTIAQLAEIASAAEAWLNEPLGAAK